jgi:hypothetical protein
LTHAGAIPDDVFFAFYKSLFENDQYDRSMNVLVDLREADSRHRNPEFLMHFADFMREEFVGIRACPKVAVVAPHDLSFGLARMYETFANSMSWDFNAFRAMDTALAWLGLPENLMNGPGHGTQKAARGHSSLIFG